MQRDQLLFLSFLAWVLLALTVGCTSSTDKIAPKPYDDQRYPEGVSKAAYQVRVPDGTNFQGARIEPPNWWVGMVDNQVEILLYDQNIRDGEVSLQYAGVSIKEVTRLENPNFLFVLISISGDCKPGSFDIKVKLDDAVRTYPYTLLERSRMHPMAFEGLHQQDVLYLLMPDRFANGDPDNDSVEGMMQNGIDRSKMYFRHGGDLQGIIDHLDYLLDLGITAIWINPVQENDQPYESYHGYAITDHYRIDRRFGTNELYRDLVKTCHEKGIKVVMDIIHNHVGDQHYFIRDLPATDWIHQHDTFWKTTYKDQVLMDPYAAEYDYQQMADGWFDNHMPDLNQKHPQVARYLIQNNLWWVEYAGINGYRIDTYAYPDQSFMADWGKSMQSHYPKLTLFAETWVHGSPNQSWFTSDNNARKGFDSYMPSVTDFQLYYAINESLTTPQGWTEGISRLYTTLSHDYLYKDPNLNVTFLDNHDLDRFYSKIGEHPEKFMTGMNWLLTMRGIPMLYYGTEILMKNFSHPDGLVREDFPGGWSEDPVSKFKSEGRSTEEQKVFSHLQQLIQLRKQHAALSSGKLTHYIPQGGTYAYFRYDQKDTFMIVANTHETAARLSTKRMGQFLSEGKQLVDAINGQLEASIQSIPLKPFESKIFKVVHRQ
jgi:glycosidase